MIGRALLVIGCGYEIVAIVSRRVPTITAICHTVSRTRIGRFLLWLWLGFVVDHFVEKELAA